MTSSSPYIVWDYIVFAVFILGCSSIAFYSKFAGPKQRTKADYVFATGSVSMAAMMLSIARGTLGVRSFLGYPSELYYRGSAMWETLYGMVLAYPIVIFVFVPVYYNLGITSVYQYLDLRFKSRLVRCLASFTYVARSLLNLGVTVFTPCVALKTVIGLPYWASILSITAISIVFTIMGGLKAAIIADVVQGVAMIACCVAIIIQGTTEVGGPANVLNISRERGRLDFFNFETDPTIRVTTLSALFGQLFMSVSVFGCQQNFVQRYVSMSSQREVTKTMMANIPVISILFSMSWIVGMVIFASYANCDPLSLGYISKIDEILPFYVEDKFAYVPGMLGLFMATLFNGGLSLAVSNLNSLATVTWEDFISQIPAFSSFTEGKQLVFIKSIGSLYGLIIMGIAFAVASLSNVIESYMLMTSATSGPLLGVFLLAMLFPCVNWKGAATGMIVSHMVTLWITFGSFTVEKPPSELLPLSIAGCTNSTASEPYTFEWANHSIAEQPLYNYGLVNDSTPTVTRATGDALDQLYCITYMYYSLIGCGFTILLGVLISYITGSSEEDAYDEKLIHPAALKLPLLTRATAETDEPTPGYMLQEIEKISYESSPHCQQLVEYLNRRLEKPSAAVKLKVLKIMLHLIQHGDVHFRQYLRGNDSYIKLASMYSGMPDAQLGMTPYENVRRRSQEVLEILFSTESIQQDECHQQQTNNKPMLGGLGSVRTSAKYDGFGSAPVQKEESFRSKMMSMLDRLMNPTDETVDTALSSSPGNYKPVNVPQVAVVNLAEPARASTTGRSFKAHVPGRAGGGWDSDSEQDNDREGSSVSADSLERVVPAEDEPSVESAAVVSFCKHQEWPLLPSVLRTQCKRFAALNCMDVMRAIASLLTSPDCTTVTALRALLVLEWFLRTDLVNVTATSRLMALPLNSINTLHFEVAAKTKAKKVQLILEKLNAH